MGIPLFLQRSQQLVLLPSLLYLACRLSFYQTKPENPQVEDALYLCFSQFFLSNKVHELRSSAIEFHTFQTDRVKEEIRSSGREFHTFQTDRVKGEIRFSHGREFDFSHAYPTHVVCGYTSAVTCPSLSG